LIIRNEPKRKLLFTVKPSKVRSLALAQMGAMSAIHRLSFVIAGVAIAGGAHAQVGSQARATVQIRVSVAPQFALRNAMLAPADQTSGERLRTMVPSGAGGFRYTLVETPMSACSEQHCGASGAPSSPLPGRYILIVPD
jgi:hypothetical protein